MQGKHQNDRKMPTRFRKQSEDLEHAIDRILVMISERRRERSLHGTNEQPLHNILTAAVELINVVKMILDILERPPLDCMSEFSSVKNDIINHITLLKYLSEQSDLNCEMESDMVFVCKRVRKMCHYILDLPPHLTGPDTRIKEVITPEVTLPKVQLPIPTEFQTMSFSMDCVPPTQHLSMPISNPRSSSERVFLLQDTPVSKKIVPGRFECFSPEWLNTPSSEGAVMKPHDEGNKSEKDVFDTKGYETSPGFLDGKNLQDLLKIESDTSVPDSGSERCVIDSDSDRGAGLDSDLEQHSNDSDSEKCPMDSAPVKHVLKAEKCQMASDSVKHLMESEEILMETEQYWMLFASEMHVMDSDMERDKIVSASASGVHLMEKEKHQEKRRTKRYTMDSDSESYGQDLVSERHELASAAAKCLMDNKTFQWSTDTEGHQVDSWSERCTMDLDSESQGMVSYSGKHMMKAESCQSASDLERLGMDPSSESESSWIDSERQKSNFNYVRCCDSSKFQYGSARLQGSAGKYQADLQKHMDNFERGQIDSDSKIRQANYENERYQNKFHSERHMIEMEREQSLTQFEIETLQKDEEQEKYVTESDSKKEHRIVSDNERHHLDSESEAQRHGARKKNNRPQGFWRPVFLSPPFGQGKNTEEKHPVRQRVNRKVSRIQLVRYLSDEMFLRFKEASATLIDKQDSQPKLKEKHSHNLSPDPNTLVYKKHQRNARQKISLCKNCPKECRHQQSFQSSRSQINPIHPLSAEDYTSEVSVPLCHPTSVSAVQPKAHSNNTHSLNTGATICSKCFKEISDSHFHKCLVDSDDSHPDYPLHCQIPMDSKYCLSPKPIRHRKTSRNCPLSQSLDPKHPVGIRCSLHQEDSKYSLGSTSYLNCESCSALQSAISFTGTSIFPMNPQNTMGYLSTPGPDSSSSSNVAGFESEGRFNLTIKFESETNLDNETKLVGAGNLEDKANDKDKPLLKDKTDHEDETDSEETDSEEKDSDDEKNTKDKKHPKDKSDPDDSDSKDSNAGNGADTNNESDPSGDADPRSGADSNSDGDSNNGSDSNSEPDSNTDSATNNDSNSKYSTDSEEDKYTNNSDNASGLNSDVDQDCTAGSDSGTDPDYLSVLQNGIVLDYTSSSSNGAGFSSATGSGNDICPNNGTSPTNEASPNNNRPGHTINEYSLQNNGPCPQNNRHDPSIPSYSNNGVGLNINGLGPNNNGPGPNNSIPGLKKDPNYNYTRPSNAATSHSSSATSSNMDADSNHDTKPTNAADHNYAAVPNYDSDLEYVPRFTHAVGYSFVVNANYIAKSSYAARPSSTASNVNGTDTNNTTSCGGAFIPSYIACTYYASDTNHNTRFTHIIGLNFVTTANYKFISTLNVHNSSTSSINNFSEPELKIRSSSSIPNIVYDNAPTFSVSTNYSSTTRNLTITKISDPSKLCRNYIIIDDHNLGVYLKDNADCMGSASFRHATESKDFLDAKESGLLKDFSRVQNSIGIKDPTSFNFHSNSNILPSFTIILEDEPSDVVKFAISSGAVNQFFKSLNNYNGVLRPERGSLRGTMLGITKRSSEGPDLGSAAGPVQEYPMGTYWRLKGGLPVRSVGGHAASPARSRSVSPAGGQADRHARGHSVSPTRRHTVSPARGCAEKQARQRVLSPSRRYAASPAHGIALGPAGRITVSPERRPTMRPTGELVLGPVIELIVEPAEGCAGEIFRSANQFTWSTTDRNQNRRGFPSMMDTNADGFIYLPEFQIALASNCRRHNAFQASHARIETFYFAAKYSDEMNYWVGQLLQLAYGSSFGDSAANEEYKCISATIHADCVLALKSEFPVIQCTNCHHQTTIVSVNPNFQYRHVQDISELIYFHPIDAEVEEESRRQKQQKPNMASHQHTPEGIHQRDLGYINQMVMATTPPLTKELERTALMRPKTSGLLRLEKIPIKSPRVPESQLLEVTGIASPKERGNGTTILVAGAPGNEELDDTEIPTLKFTGFIHLEALINKCSPSSEHSCLRTPRNLWLESPENSESPGSDDLEVARSMHPFRERPILRRSWEELLEAPLNSEGLHILQTISREEREFGYLQLPTEEENQAITSLRGHHLHALQGSFPLLPQRPKLQRQCSHSLPRYSDIRTQGLNALELTLNPEETCFFPRVHNLFTGENAKERAHIEEASQKVISSASGDHPSINSSFENSSAMRGKIGIPGDNPGHPRGHVRVPKSNVPMVNVGVPISNIGVSIDNDGIPMNNAEVPLNNP